MRKFTLALVERLQAHAPRPVLDAARSVVEARVSRRARRFYPRFVQPGDLVFDVGAHVGLRTGVFLALGASVVAVEPQQSCVKTLRDKYGANPNVEIVPLALAETEREAELFVCSRATTITTLSRDWMHGRFASYTWDRAEPIHTTTLDALIAQRGVPRFCKVDVEGFEFDVLCGLSQPLPALSIEFVHETLGNTFKCLDRLQEIGFSKFNYSLGESMQLQSEQPMSREALTADLSSLTSTLAWGDVYGMA